MDSINASSTKKQSHFNDGMEDGAKVSFAQRVPIQVSKRVYHPHSLFESKTSNSNIDNVSLAKYTASGDTSFRDRGAHGVQQVQRRQGDQRLLGYTHGHNAHQGSIIQKGGTNTLISIRDEDLSLYFRNNFSILAFSLTTYLTIFTTSSLPLLQWLNQFIFFKILKYFLIIVCLFEFILILLKVKIISWKRSKLKNEEDAWSKGIRQATLEDVENAKLLGMTIERYLYEKSLSNIHERPPLGRSGQDDKSLTVQQKYVKSPIDLDDIFIGEVVKMDEMNQGYNVGPPRSGFPFNFAPPSPGFSSVLKLSSTSGSTPLSTTNAMTNLKGTDQKNHQLPNIQPIFRRRARNDFQQLSWDGTTIADKSDLNQYLERYTENIQQQFTAEQKLGKMSYGSNRLGVPTVGGKTLSTLPYPTGYPSSLQQRQGYRGIQGVDLDLANDMGNLGEYEDFPHFQEAYKEAQFSLKQINIDSRQLVTWSDNLRRWIVDNILKSLVSSVEENNKELKELGLGSYDCFHCLDEPPQVDTRIPDNIPPPIDGRLTLRYILATVAQSNVIIKNRLMLEYYLDIPSSSRKYVIKRIKDLASSSFMESFKWNSGSSFEGQKWDPRMNLPNDSQLIIHVFRKWMDLLFPADSLYGQNSFSLKHFLDQSMMYGKKTSLDSNLYIVLESLQPPHFSLVHNKKLIRVEPGRNNLFHTLCIFIYIVKTHFKGTLDHTWLGSQNFNVLKVVDNGT